MKTKNRPFYKQGIFWKLCAAAVVLAAVGCLIIWNTDQRQTEARTETKTKTQTTASSSLLSREREQALEGLAKNPFTAQDFTYQGYYLSCRSQPYMLGIDVSEWQGEIDWDIVQAAGMEFAMLRLGFRGTTQGALTEDSCAYANYTAAKEAGMKVGGYFFSQAVSEQEAVEEAEFVLSMIEGWELDMPIVFDWEYGGADSRTANVDARTLTDCAKAFCRTIEEAGFRAMIYFNESQSYQKLYLEELTDYEFWLAKYQDTLEYPYRVDMWQYTDSARVPGINTNVDVDLYFIYE